MPSTRKLPAGRLKKQFPNSRWCRTRIKKPQHAHNKTVAALFVIPSGFEPETHSLEGCCSIQLSYGTSGCKVSNLFGIGMINYAITALHFSYLCEQNLMR